MKDKLLLLETKCPRGHVNLYRAQIKDYCEHYNVTFATTPAYFEFFADLPIQQVDIPSSNRSWKGKAKHRVQQILRMVPVLRRWRKDGFTKCIVLSYDTVSLALISRFLDLRDVYFFTHNNIDETLKSKAKRFFFRAISKSVTFCVFEEYISDFLRREYGVNALSVHHDRRKMVPSHPLNLAPTNGRSFVFCPSFECEGRFLVELVRYCEKEDMLLVTKAHQALPESPLVISKDRFENYDDLFVAAEFIAIGVNYNYRITGAYYEALGNGKKVIANDCLFMRSVGEHLDEPPVFLMEKHAT